MRLPYTNNLSSYECCDVAYAIRVFKLLGLRPVAWSLPWTDISLCRIRFVSLVYASSWYNFPVLLPRTCSNLCCVPLATNAAFEPPGAPKRPRGWLFRLPDIYCLLCGSGKLIGIFPNPITVYWNIIHGLQCRIANSFDVHIWIVDRGSQRLSETVWRRALNFPPRCGLFSGSTQNLSICIYRRLADSKFLTLCQITRYPRSRFFMHFALALHSDPIAYSPWIDTSPSHFSRNIWKYIN